MFGRKKDSPLAHLRTAFVFLGLVLCIFAVGMALAPELIVTFLPLALGMSGLIFIGVGWMATRS